jgi:hypothetical protein
MMVNFIGNVKNNTTIRPLYNDHPRDLKFVAVADRLSLFRGRFML